MTGEPQQPNLDDITLALADCYNCNKTYCPCITFPCPNCGCTFIWVYPEAAENMAKVEPPRNTKEGSNNGKA